MIDATRLSQAIRGLQLLLRLDPAAFSFFERNYAGFVRSFFPAVVLAPLHALHGWLAYAAKTEKPPAAVYAATELISYVLAWTLFPFVMMYVTRMLGRAERYFTYMVPYNWLQLPIGLVFMPLALLVDVGLLSINAAAFFNFILVTVLALYGTFLARAALAVAMSAAIGVVVLDVVLALLADAIIGRI